MVTPQQLFDFASTYASTAEAEGKTAQYPSVREAARKFNVTQQAIRDACDEYHGKGYMRPAVGFAVGGRIGAHATPGDHLVEAYE